MLPTSGGSWRIGRQVPKNRSMQPSPQLRSPAPVLGLDLLRSVAILLVFVGHAGYFVPPHLFYTYLHFSPDGVSLFFTLSGFLISRSLLHSVERHGAEYHVFALFWLKRVVRTIPPYLVAFVLFGVLRAYTSGTAFSLPAETLFLVGNFAWKHPVVFPESWSLSVEEWFYASLILSVGLSAFSLPFRTLRQGACRLLVVSACLFCLMIVYRILWYTYAAPGSPISAAYFADMSATVLGRIDGPALGVSAGVFSLLYPKIWSSWAFKRACFWAGMFLVVASHELAVLAFEPSLEQIRADLQWIPPVSLSTIPLGFTLLLPQLSDLRSAAKPIGSIARYFSARAFSIYLINFSIVAFLLLPALERYFVLPLAWRYALFLVLSLVLAEIFYVLVERPFYLMKDLFNPWRLSARSLSQA